MPEAERQHEWNSYSRTARCSSCGMLKADWARNGGSCVPSETGTNYRLAPVDPVLLAQERQRVKGVTFPPPEQVRGASPDTVLLDEIENFADAPISLGELRSDRSDDAADWTPRDVLVSLLRTIDKGEIDPETLIVCFDHRGHPEARPSYRASSKGLSYSLKVIAYAQARIMGLIANLE